MRGKDEKKEKAKRRRMDFMEPENFEAFEDKLRLRYGCLLIREMNDERKMRNKALRLSRRRKKQVEGWVF